MIRNLLNFTADLLSYKGAIVEASEDYLEALLPPDMAEALGTAEHAKLSFSIEREGIPFISYDSEVFKNMERLIGKRGRFYSVKIPAPSVRLEKIEDRLHDRITFNNAVFHLERKGEKTISYLLGYFKYTAISDERQEGITASLINEFNLSVRQFRTEDMDILDNAGDMPLHHEPVESVERQEYKKVIESLYLSQREMTRESLKDFIRSLERRLNRDIQRVHEYYRTLIHETRQFIEKKSLDGEEKEKALNKIKAIDTELEWKVQDIINKYSLNIRIEPISFIRFETVVPVFYLKIKRRKGEREFPLTYNPLLKSLDSLPCESCFNPKRVYSVCDDKLHILCPQCFRVCPKCGRDYCSACHKTGCPKCGFI
jgi:hypothetical protein